MLGTTHPIGPSRMLQDQFLHALVEGPVPVTIYLVNGIRLMGEINSHDQHGQTIDFLLRRDPGIAAAQAFFRKALHPNGERFPRTVTLDGHVPSRSALWKLRREHIKWRHVRVRTCKYRNNIVEQDHRGIKARCGPLKGVESFVTAAVTLAGLNSLTESASGSSTLDAAGDASVSIGK